MLTDIGVLVLVSLAGYLLGRWRERRRLRYTLRSRNVPTVFYSGWDK
jgi:hypothetical protein